MNTLNLIKRAFPSLRKNHSVKLQFNFENYFHFSVRNFETNNWEILSLKILFNWSIHLLNNNEEIFKNFKRELNNHINIKSEHFGKHGNPYKFLSLLNLILQGRRFKKNFYPVITYNRTSGQINIDDMIPFKVEDNSRFGGFVDTEDEKSVENLIKRNDTIISNFSHFYKIYFSKEIHLKQYDHRKRERKTIRSSPIYSQEKTDKAKDFEIESLKHENLKLKSEILLLKKDLENTRNNLLFTQNKMDEQTKMVNEQAKLVSDYQNAYNNIMKEKTYWDIKKSNLERDLKESRSVIDKIRDILPIKPLVNTFDQVNRFQRYSNEMNMVPIMSDFNEMSLEQNPDNLSVNSGIFQPGTNYFTEDPIKSNLKSW